MFVQNNLKIFYHNGNLIGSERRAGEEANGGERVIVEARFGR